MKKRKNRDGKQRKMNAVKKIMVQIQKRIIGEKKNMNMKLKEDECIEEEKMNRKQKKFKVQKTNRKQKTGEQRTERIWKQKEDEWRKYSMWTENRRRQTANRNQNVREQIRYVWRT